MSGFLINSYRFSSPETWPTWTGVKDGSAVQFETGATTTTTLINSALISTDVSIIVYVYNSLVKAVIATTSGNNVSYGSAVTVASVNAVSVSVCGIDSGRAMCVYTDASSFAKAAVLSISGTTITVNTAATVDNTGNCHDLSVVKITTDQCVLSYAVNGTGTAARCLSTPASATTVTVRTRCTLSTTEYDSLSSGALSSTAVFVAYAASGGNGLCVVASISGDTVTVPTAESTFQASSTTSITVAALDSTHAILACADAGDSGYGKSYAFSISGTTITTGTVNAFETSAAIAINSSGTRCGITSIDSSTALLMYRTSSITYGMAFTVSGTTITAYTRVQLSSGSTSFTAPIALDGNRVLGIYQDSGSSGRGTGLVLSIV